LLEVPYGLHPDPVRSALAHVGAELRYVTASHDHEDHLDPDAWAALSAAFPDAEFVHPAEVEGDHLLSVGGEPLWLVKGPKHSRTDVVTVFRGVAMTGDIELGTVKSVNKEVPIRVKRQSLKWLAGFCDRTGYQVHSIVSAHLNDLRTGVDWPALFTPSPASDR
jgi:hydroxyacylglutathione hydrolase